MTNIAVADALSVAKDLIIAGDNGAAKRHIATALTVTDDLTRRILDECSWRLLNTPDSALSDLATLARHAATEDDAALIAACTPDRAEYRARPETRPERAREPRWSTNTRHQAARDNPTRTDPHARRSPAQQRRIGQAQPPMTVVDFFAYTATLGEFEEIRDTDDDMPGYAHDYDDAAKHPLRGEPCLFCWLERANYEIHTDRYKAGHGDDGLCGDCRERGYTPGIPALPQGHSYAAHVLARCAYIAERHPLSALNTLAREWQRGRRCSDPRTCNPETCTRHIIEGWITKHRARLELRAIQARYETDVRAIQTRATEPAAPATVSFIDTDRLPNCRRCRAARHRATDFPPRRNRDDFLCIACRGDHAQNTNEQRYRETYIPPIAA